MLKVHRLLVLLILVSVSPALGLAKRAETLKFVWPDGASAKVHARSEGRRTGTGKDIVWDMSADFTWQVRRAGDRVVVSREDFPGWKGTFPPSFGGGAERFTDMIPTFVVSGAGEFIGIEGHEAARKLINRSVEQSGGMDAASRGVFEKMTSDAALRAMASDYWSMLVGLWQDVEFDPEAVYELHNVTSVPQLGGGELEINGAVKFVKEAPCASGGGDQRRCLHFQAETAANKEQVVKLVQSLVRQAVAGAPVVTGWDQRFKVDIVVDKATTLPQRLTLTRLHTIEASLQGRAERISEEITKSYTFTWTLPEGGGKK